MPTLEKMSISCPSVFTKEQIEQLISWINSNPGMSKVERIEKEEYNSKETYKDFQIIREDSFLKDKKKALKNLFYKRLKTEN